MAFAAADDEDGSRPPHDDLETLARALGRARLAGAWTTSPLGSHVVLTVMFATFNGADTLPRMMAALTLVEAPRGGWKLVAIDNGSTDSSAEIIAGFGDRLPIELLSFERPGKNAALNHGLPSIEGDLVVMTDDDVLPCREWLVALRAAADENRDVAVFGGPILLAWDTPPPPWIERGIPFPAAYGENRVRAEDGPAPPPSMWGANVALRSNLFAEGLRFDERVGPGPGAYVMGSESELLHRLQDQGARGWFANRAVVHHIIGAHQLELAWLRRRAFRKGRAEARKRGRQAPVNRPGRRSPRQDLAGAFSRLAGGFLAGDKSRVYRESWNAWLAMGVLYELRMMARGRR